MTTTTEEHQEVAPDMDAQFAADTGHGPKLITFGCRLNIYESEVIKDHAKKAGLDNAIIINTCAVTNEAVQKARQAVRRARRDNPEAKVIVTGCAAQLDPHGFGNMPEVDHVVGNDLKLKAEGWNNLHGTERLRVNDIMEVRETANHLISGFDDHARAFVQVQNGCDHRCTFCIIPFARGNSRSVAMGEIVDQVRTLTERGYQEIVLTGVDITSYGPDLPGKPTLGQMMRRLLALVPDVKRLRLSSLDPMEIDDDLWRLIAEEPRLMPHLHLSMQAGDDMILKRMKRRHLRNDIYTVTEKARSLRPDIVFGADIIAGFPTETPEMFENTYNTAKDCNLTFLHVFPYSARTGTPAARMPQVDGNLRKDRAKRLRDLGEELLNNHVQSLVGKTLPVLTERGNKGHTEYFSAVTFDGDVPAGRIINMKMLSAENGILKGAPC